MKHETKLGIAFIGILLTTFGLLLMKKLSRPGNAALAHARQSSGTAETTPGKVAFQSAAPTLLTPKSENCKPPESNLADNSKKHTEHAAKANRPAEQERAEFSPPAPTEKQPPLLATPLPANDVGDRYAGAKSRDPFESSNNGAGQPYRSGYPTASDAHPDAQLNGGIKAVEQPLQADRERQTHETSEPRYGGGARYGELAESAPASPPPAPKVERYTPPQRTPEVYPIATNEPVMSNQHYSSGNMPVASTGTIVPTAAGIQRDGDMYTVQPNDTFWIISEKAYGTGAFFKALYEHNRKRHPEADELKVGQQLSVPEESILRRAYPDLCPRPKKQLAGVQQRLTAASTRMRGTGRVYTVEEGDTLFEIAKRELGKPSRWSEIYDLNRDVLGEDSDYLRPGLELILPDEKPHNDNVTRQPGSVYPR